jgi:hypothetical protein
MEIVEAVQRLFVLPNYQFYSDPLGYDERFERWRGRASRPDRKRSNEPRAGTTSGSERERERERKGNQDAPSEKGICDEEVLHWESVLQHNRS